MTDSLVSSTPSPPPQPHYDCLVAGAGIAGATAAYKLSTDRTVLLVDPEGAAGGASAAAAGLVNPFMGRKARPTWKIYEALNALDQLLEESDAEHTCRRQGVFRPARSEKQVAFFEESIENFSDLAEIVGRDEASQRFPTVNAPHGGLWIPRGCSVDMEGLIRLLQQRIISRGQTYAEGWALDTFREEAGIVIAILTNGDQSIEVSTDILIISVGQGCQSIEALCSLGLRAVKGQTITVRSVEQFKDLPALSGYGYAVPTSKDTCIIGSTYDHEFENLKPSREEADYLLGKAANMISGIDQAEVTGMRAGARVFPPSSHLPWIGPIVESERIWFYGALGSRGLLTAPLISSNLIHYLENSSAIPEQIRLKTDEKDA